MVNDFIQRSELPEEQHVYILMDRVDASTWNLVALNADTKEAYKIFLVMDSLPEDTGVLSQAFNDALDLAGNQVGRQPLGAGLPAGDEGRAFFASVKAFGCYWFYKREQNSINLFATPL